MKTLSKYPLHPFLLAIYPVVVLLALNPGELQLTDAFRSLVLSVSLAAVLFLVLRVLFRNSAKAAVLTSVTLILFFSYGHVYELIRNVNVASVLVGRHRFLIAIWILIVAVVVWLVSRRPSIDDSITVFLNAFSVLALVVPVAQWLFAGTSTLAPEDTEEIMIEPLSSVEAPIDTTPPDIFYIVLDAYTREDVLLDVYEYDNSPFLESLEDLGFTVAQDSRSNYAVTRLSIPSALNMDYVEEFGLELDPAARDAAWLDQAAKGNAVSKTFHDLGYQVVGFDSGYGMTNWTDADLYLTPQPLSMSDQQAFGGLNSLEVLLLQTSMGRLAVDFGTVINNLIGTEIEAPHQTHANRISFALDRLGRMAEIEGPKFVFMHLMSPHPPYVFAPSGELKGGDEIFTLRARGDDVGEIEGYRDQVAYLNSRLEQELGALLETSEVEPIIIIQGDHGALGVSPEDRMKILNAYYLPEGGGALIYHDISPVNTFRLIFDQYFGSDLTLLEDASYYSDLESPFDLRQIP